MRSAKFEKSSLYSKIENVNKVVNNPSATLQVIKETQQSMKDQLQRCLSTQRDLMLELSDEEEADKEFAICDELDEFEAVDAFLDHLFPTFGVFGIIRFSFSSAILLDSALFARAFDILSSKSSSSFSSP